MTTPNTKNGITKDSTLLINVPQYLSNNFTQTLNYVGYWKWDSTNQRFIQVLNNQDIIDEKYNLKIEPLFYDADTGLPQKVTVNSGNTKKLKMVNDNNDGASELAEYVENNTMVRFNSKTRSITEYPYFEVEALPPTITSPIESNGYYKFDGNTLVSGTSSDYNLHIDIPQTISNIVNINKLRMVYSSGDPEYNLLASQSNWTYYSNSTTLTNTNNKVIISIYYWHGAKEYRINYFNKYTSDTFQAYGNSWVYISSSFSTNYALIAFNDSSRILIIPKINGSDISTYMALRIAYFKINSNWMTFDRLN